MAAKAKVTVEWNALFTTARVKDSTNTTRFLPGDEIATDRKTLQIVLDDNRETDFRIVHKS